MSKIDVKTVDQATIRLKELGCWLDVDDCTLYETLRGLKINHILFDALNFFFPYWTTKLFTNMKADDAQRLLVMMARGMPNPLYRESVRASIKKKFGGELPSVVIPASPAENKPGDVYDQCIAPMYAKAYKLATEAKFPSQVDQEEAAIKARNGDEKSKKELDVKFDKLSVDYQAAVVTEMKKFQAAEVSAVSKAFREKCQLSVKKVLQQHKVIADKDVIIVEEILAQLASSIVLHFDAAIGKEFIASNFAIPIQRRWLKELLAAEKELSAATIVLPGSLWQVLRDHIVEFFQQAQHADSKNSADVLTKCRTALQARNIVGERAELLINIISRIVKSKYQSLANSFIDDAVNFRHPQFLDIENFNVIVAWKLEVEFEKTSIILNPELKNNLCSLLEAFCKIYCEYLSEKGWMAEDTIRKERDQMLSIIFFDDKKQYLENAEKANNSVTKGTMVFSTVLVKAQKDTLQYYKDAIAKHLVNTFLNEYRELCYRLAKVDKVYASLSFELERISKTPELQPVDFMTLQKTIDNFHQKCLEVRKPKDEKAPKGEKTSLLIVEAVNQMILYRGADIRHLGVIAQITSLTAQLIKAPSAANQKKYVELIEQMIMKLDVPCFIGEDLLLNQLMMEGLAIAKSPKAQANLTPTSAWQTKQPLLGASAGTAVAGVNSAEPNSPLTVGCGKAPVYK